MGAYSEIGWTDHTFNPWEGCQRVSPAPDGKKYDGVPAYWRPNFGLKQELVVLA